MMARTSQVTVKQKQRMLVHGRGLKNTNDMAGFSVITRSKQIEMQM